MQLDYIHGYRLEKIAKHFASGWTNTLNAYSWMRPHLWQISYRRTHKMMYIGVLSVKVSWQT